jgi:ABC-2 type transport system permease protein
MEGFGKLALVETRLFLREKIALAGIFAVPIGILIGFGLIPGFSSAQKDLNGQRGTEYIAAVAIAIVLVSIGLQGVPMVVAQYRERGILRRLGVTPVRPLTLLIAKLAVYAGAAAVSALMIVVVSRVAFHIPLPAEPGWFLVALTLGIAALFGLGMLVAAVAPTARSSTAIGMALFFPNMFLAGVYFPSDKMSPGLRQAGNLTPLGASLHAIRDSWTGVGMRPQYLLVMAGYALVTAALAARFFRWDKA